MKKLILIGRSEAGKTTLRQALYGVPTTYEKTQAVFWKEDVIDTPGEYFQTKNLGGALAVYSCEADVIGLLLSAKEPYSLFPPCVAAAATRPVIGIVSQCHSGDADPDLAAQWLSLAGCERIFRVDAVDGTGIEALRAYLMEDSSS